MRAVVLEGVARLVVREDAPRPEPGPGQVRVRVSACGVCRTDLHVVDGELPASKLPLVHGHEIVGGSMPWGRACRASPWARAWASRGWAGPAGPVRPVSPAGRTSAPERVSPVTPSTGASSRGRRSHQASAVRPPPARGECGVEPAKRGVALVPSESGVYRALVRAGMIDPADRDRRSRKWKRWERGMPMELWQLDVVRGFPLADGTSAKVLTGIDDHSRICVCARVMAAERTRAVCDGLAAALNRYGAPEQIRLL